jgi:predicted HicB family RNase H-like nuclease
MNGTVRMEVRLSNVLRNAIKRDAAKRGLSMNAYVVHCLRNRIHRRARRQKGQKHDKGTTR